MLGMSILMDSSRIQIPQNQTQIWYSSDIQIGPGTYVSASVAFSGWTGDIYNSPPTSATVSVSLGSVSGGDPTNPVSWTYQLLGNFIPAQQYAEAIMERPQYTDANGNYVSYDLANYNTWDIYFVNGGYWVYGDPDDPWQPTTTYANTGNSLQVTMINTIANTLSSCDIIDSPGHVHTTWHAAR